jgi:hypothetical protein
VDTASYATLWRRLAELTTWKPLETAFDLHEIMQDLAVTPITYEQVSEWLSGKIVAGQGPALIRAARGARELMNRPGMTKPLSLDGLFAAACLWRENGFGSKITLPFWLAAE